MTFTLSNSYSFQGLPIAIETQAGDLRMGTDPDGNKWSIVMKHDYGYIRGGAMGKDGEAIDCYIGPNRKAEHVYVIRQHAIELVKQWGGNFCPNCTQHAHDCLCLQYYDEDKIMLGFNSKEEAKQAYLAHYDSDLFLGPIVAFKTEDFKTPEFLMNQAMSKVMI